MLPVRRSAAALVLFLTLILGGHASAVARDSNEIGPTKGTLIIIGGGGRSQPIIQRFIKMAGGPDAPLVAIPTADDQDDKGEQIAAFLRKAGSTQVTVLHTRDPKIADTEEFVRPLLTARGVWLGGGRQWRMPMPTLARGW